MQTGAPDRDTLRILGDLRGEVPDASALARWGPGSVLGELGGAFGHAEDCGAYCWQRAWLAAVLEAHHVEL